MKPPAGFAGFPEGKTRLTPIPSAFFTELLPVIDHLGELKVSLYAFWALARKTGEVRYLRRTQMSEDIRLLDSLRQPGTPAEAALDEALERAVARGTLLHAAVQVGGHTENLYFLNTPKGRAALESLESGDWSPSNDPEAPLSLEVDRPNIFSLYEQNIGPLTPMLAEALHDAEMRYPHQWIEQAIRIAVENNARKWRYVEAILEDWKSSGRDEREDRGDSEAARRRYVEGDYADFIEH